MNKNTDAIDATLNILFETAEKINNMPDAEKDNAANELVRSTASMYESLIMANGPFLAESLKVGAQIMSDERARAAISNIAYSLLTLKEAMLDVGEQHSEKFAQAIEEGKQLQEEAMQKHTENLTETFEAMGLGNLMETPEGETPSKEDELVH